MIRLNNLNGKINQLTLHGQLAFIKGEVYDVIKTNTKFVVLVRGNYLIVYTDEKISASIEFEEKELEKY